MSNKVRVRLILGVSHDDIGDDRATPVVAGCMDMTTWEIIAYSEIDRVITAMKRMYDPGLDYYEWREVVAEFDSEPLRALFNEADPIVGKLA